MMRNNGLLKWTLHKNKNGTNGKNWIHPPEALSSGHVAYLVKFLGVTEAELPKGMEIVKDSIRKLKLDEEIRRAEGGKTPKAEVTISMDGVAIQEPKGKKILHQFPLHQISYCADDKDEKRYFSFIAKEGDVHKCFVFASDKLAEEITLTIGQAFDLAYKRYLESSGRELDLKKEIMNLQKRVAELENENSNLKEKLSLHSVDGQSNSSLSSAASNNGGDLICPPVPSRTANVANQIIAEFAMAANEIEKKRGHNGRYIDGGSLFDDEFDVKPRGTPDGIEAPPRISPPPKGKRSDAVSTPAPKTNGFEKTNGGGGGSSFGGSSTDVFGSDPFFTSSALSSNTTPSSSSSSSSSADPFGMSSFGGSTTTATTNGFGSSSNINNHVTMSNGFSSSNNNISSQNNIANNNKFNSNMSMNFSNTTTTSSTTSSTTRPNYNIDLSNLFINSSLDTNKRLEENSGMGFSFVQNNNNSNSSNENNSKAKIDLSSLDMLDPFRT